jgi:Zn-finger nucleic acid-binding protein
VLRSATIGEASVEICGKCSGTFFDSEDLFAAAGLPADPSTWDRPETGGNVKPSELACPGCEATMDAQDVAYQGKQVEIDRCGKCKGIWLDKGELDTLVSIGEGLAPLVEAARAKAKQELEDLDKKGGVDFRKRSPEEERRFRIRVGLIALAIVGIGTLFWWANRPEPRVPIPEGGTGTRAKGEEGCPCGCDRSKAMAAELRAKEDASALASIEETLVTIGKREDAGYVTERMVEHRLRMLDVAEEIFDRQGERPGFPELHRLTASQSPEGTSRCATARVEGDGIRVCSELAVHGERTEIVKGAPKLITSCFRLWLEIENTGDAARTFARPSIDASAAHLPITRWYREGGAGRPWDGVVGAHEKVRVNVIGDIPERVMPGTMIDAKVMLDRLVLHTPTEARAVIHFRNR